VEASAPTPDDLAGLLAGGGQVTRRGPQARVSIVVDHPWRAAAVVAECGRCGVSATTVSTVDGHVGVRTVYSALLTPLAEAWTRGAAKQVPSGFVLGGRMLRLWAAAQGRPGTGLGTASGTGLGTASGSGLGAVSGTGLGRLGGPLGIYLLALGHLDTPIWGPLGSALAAVGLAAQLVTPRGAGPAYRIAGRRRISRLTEMVGDPPKQAPPGVWPS
jgi:hypothetical protein